MEIYCNLCIPTQISTPNPLSYTFQLVLHAGTCTKDMSFESLNKTTRACVKHYIPFIVFCSMLHTVMCMHINGNKVAYKNNIKNKILQNFNMHFEKNVCVHASAFSNTIKYASEHYT